MALVWLKFQKFKKTPTWVLQSNQNVIYIYKLNYNKVNLFHKKKKQFEVSQPTVLFKSPEDDVFPQITALFFIPALNVLPAAIFSTVFHILLCATNVLDTTLVKSIIIHKLWKCLQKWLQSKRKKLQSPVLTQKFYASLRNWAFICKSTQIQSNLQFILFPSPVFWEKMRIFVKVLEAKALK